MNVVIKATAFAADRHRNQRRKDSEASTQINPEYPGKKKPAKPYAVAGFCTSPELAGIFFGARAGMK